MVQPLIKTNSGTVGAVCRYPLTVSLLFLLSSLPFLIYNRGESLLKIEGMKATAVNKKGKGRKKK